MKPLTATFAALSLAALLSGAAVQAASTGPFSSFWVLGDSLSDPGNLYAATGGTMPQSPPYFEGRFSNGRVWAEHVADGFNAKGLATGNVAYGGAKAISDGVDAPDLADQVGLFALGSAGHLGARPLASIWIGANDLLFDGVPNGQATRVGREAARSVATNALALGGLGVGDVMLFNMPDLGSVPRYALSPDPLERARATRGSRAFNRTIDAQIPKLEAAGLNVIKVDIADVFRRLIANPQDFGVQNASIPCLLPGQLPCSAEQALTLAFFDPVHPNSVIHGDIAGIAGSEIAAVPLPLPGVLLLAGLGAIALVRRRATTRLGHVTAALSGPGASPAPAS